MKIPYSTLAIMLNAHNGQKDKGGEAYALHPIRVAYRLMLTGKQAAIRAALLHDVIEDTQVTEAELQRLGEPAAVVNIVLWVSRPKERPRATYLEWISDIALKAPLGARLVKLADIYDNLSPSRMAALSESEQDGMTRRYERALEMLLPCIPEHLAQLVLQGDVTPCLGWEA